MEDPAPYNGHTQNVSRYIELFCDPESPLWKIPDYAKRKEEALKQAGFKKHETLYGQILNDTNQTVIEREIEYAFDKGGVKMAAYISLLKNYWQTLARVAQPVGNGLDEDKELKCYDLKMKLRSDLDKAIVQLEQLESSLFDKDSVLRKKVVAKVRENLSAESRATTNSVK